MESEGYKQASSTEQAHRPADAGRCLDQVSRTENGRENWLYRGYQTLTTELLEIAWKQNPSVASHSTHTLHTCDEIDLEKDEVVRRQVQRSGGQRADSAE
jgi:hypothetical protein